MREQKSFPFILGLDIGASSVGWALLETKDNTPNSIIGLGARVFEAGVKGLMEQGKEESRNKQRRDARMHRRVLARHTDRMKDLWSLLQGAGLLPKGNPDGAVQALDKEISETWAQKLGLEQKGKEQEKARFSHVIPYFLRARALDEKLLLNELGRALYHLAQRRGFQSNRKATPKGEKAKKDEGEMKESISELERKISESGARTLGEYFSRLDPEGERIRQRYTSRKMYKEEFAAIWKAQVPHYLTILTEEFKKEVFNAIFYQRPLKIRKEFIGNCEFEEGRKRAPWALLAAQRFRLLQKVNDLEYTDTTTGEVRRLSPEERAKLIEALEIQGDLKFSKVRTLLKLPRGRFNFERDEDDNKLIGNRTASRLVKIFGEERWKEFPQEQREQIVEDVRSIPSDQALARRGKKAWGLDDEKAEKFGQLPLDEGYCYLSRQALAKLLPLMEQDKRYATAVKQVYGDRPVQKPVDLLPPVLEVFTDLRNPVVARTLTELRKVVNNVVRQYGKPDKIHIELARDLKKSRKDRTAIWKKNEKNRKAREEAGEKIFKEIGIEKPSRSDKEKVLLWEECNHLCPYTGKSINMKDLFGDNPQFDVEHIIPFNRCLDNSFYNKTLCYVEENRNRKGNKTPFEAYGSDPKGWEEILGRIRNFKSEARDAKLRLFLLQGKALEEYLDNFTNSQLNDTAYASRLAMEYSGLLYGTRNGVDASGKRRVQAGRGQVTQYLRDEWGLNKILKDGGQKSRDDHRHHSVDAVCIALTDVGTVKMLSGAAGRARLERRKRFGKVDPPWPEFLDDVRRSIEEVVVSHRVSRKVSGPLHKETIYSPPIPGKDEKGKAYEFRHIRKPLEKLFESEVKEIADPEVKKLVLEKLGNEVPKKFFTNKENHPHLTTKDGRKIPIHKVRIRKKISTFTVGEGPRQRHVTTENNHHIEVVEVLDKKGNPRWDGFLVNLKDAYRRLREDEPVVKRDHGEGKRFVFSLAGGETIEIDEENGGRGLYVIRTIARMSGDPRIEFVRLQNAQKKKEIIKAGDWRTKFIEPLRKLNCRKVLVTPLGEVRRASD